MDVPLQGDTGRHTGTAPTTLDGYFDQIPTKIMQHLEIHKWIYTLLMHIGELSTFVIPYGLAPPL